MRLEAHAISSFARELIFLYAPQLNPTDDDSTRKQKLEALQAAEGIPDLRSQLVKKKKGKNRASIIWSKASIRHRRALKHAASMCSVGFARRAEGGCIVWTPPSKKPVVYHVRESTTSDFELMAAVTDMPQPFVSALRAYLDEKPTDTPPSIPVGQYGPSISIGCQIVAWDLNQDVNTDFRERLRDVEKYFGLGGAHIAVMHPRAAARRRWTLLGSLMTVVVTPRKHDLLSLVSAAKPTDIILCSRNKNLALQIAITCPGTTCSRVDWGTNKRPCKMVAENIDLKHCTEADDKRQRRRTGTALTTAVHRKRSSLKQVECC